MLVSGIFLYVVAGVLLPVQFLVRHCCVIERVLWCSEDEILESFCRYSCGTCKAFGVSAFLESVRHHWWGTKVSTQRENMKHGLELRKIYQQKLLRIVSNIGSRTFVLLLLLLKHATEYLSLPPTRHDLTQGQKPEGQLKWGRGGRERAETRTLLVCAAHRLT